MAANVNPADGVTSIDLVYNYDPSLLLPTGVFKTGYTNGFTLVSSIGMPGRVEIHLSGGDRACRERGCRLGRLPHHRRCPARRRP